MSTAATADSTGLPMHLAQPPEPAPDQALATLYHDGTAWVLEGDPQVVVFAKRLFPGSASAGRGACRFPTSRRTFGDLVWLRQRFPITVDPASTDAWDRAYDAACDTARRMTAFETRPRAVLPPATFRGELRPYQKEALSWCRANPRTLLGDEMGLGKTVSALAWLADRAAWPALVVVPPHLIRHWQDKAGAFLGADDATAPLLHDGVVLHRIKGQTPYTLPDAHIYLTHYGLVSHWREALMALGAPTLIFDEIQELRRTGSRKYSACHEIAQQADGVLGLSGTPIYNRGGEIWAVLNILEMHCLGDWDIFTRERCLGYGSDIVADPEALGQALRRQGLLLRRRKEDVLTDLPPKRRVIESVDAAEGLAEGLVEEALAKVASGDAAGDAFERGREHNEAIGLMRQATGAAKAENVGHFVNTLVDAGEPTIVFVHHHQVVDTLRATLNAPAVITGRQSEKGKEEAKRRFVEGETDVVLVGLRSAAGLDGLQARARCVVFAELDWSPAVHGQAEDRAHRDGQQDSVLAYYLVADWGSDPAIMDSLGLKASQARGLLADDGETEDDRAVSQQDAREHMQAVIQRLRNKQERKAG